MADGFFQIPFRQDPDGDGTRRARDPNDLLEERKGLRGLFDSQPRRAQRAMEQKAFNDLERLYGGEDFRKTDAEVARESAAATEAQAGQAAAAAATLGQQQLATDGQMAGQFEEAQKGAQGALTDAFYKNYASANQNANAEALAVQEAIQARAAAMAQQQMERRKRNIAGIVRGITAAITGASSGLFNKKGDNPTSTIDTEMLSADDGAAMAGQTGGAGGE